MSKRDKLRRKLRNNPKDVKFQELETLLTRFNFVLMRVSGSHHIFRYDDGEHTENLVIPVHTNKVKAFYVKEVLDILDMLFPESSDLSIESDDEDEDE